MSIKFRFKIPEVKENIDIDSFVSGFNFAQSMIKNVFGSETDGFDNVKIMTGDDIGAIVQAMEDSSSDLKSELIKACKHKSKFFKGKWKEDNESK